ncbi:MAG: hypothetical protein SNJ70_02335 [Armatimonadota bacterium]
MDLTTLFVVTLTTSRMIMPGMPNLPMMGDFNKPITTLTMTLTSPKSVDKNSKAECAVPEGLKLGPKVDLTIDLPTKDEQVPDGPVYDDEQKPEKEEEYKFISYWKCSETVPAGQPKVISSKEINSSIKDAMKNRDVQKKMSSAFDRMDRDKYSYAYWPGNDKKNIKKESTAPGKYVLSTNYTGGTSFALANSQDFLAPFEVISPGKKVDFEQAIKVEWKKIPNALAYQISAFSGEDNEMITWTSSSDPESTAAFMGEPISKAKVDELIKSGYYFLLIPLFAISQLAYSKRQRMYQSASLQLVRIYLKPKMESQHMFSSDQMLLLCLEVWEV